MSGLCIRQKLSKDLRKYEKGTAMRNMITKFKENVAVTDITDEECERLESIDHQQSTTRTSDRDSSAAF